MSEYFLSPKPVVLNARGGAVAMADFSTACLASVGVCLLEWGGSQWLRTSVDTDRDNWKGSGRPPCSFNS